MTTLDETDPLIGVDGPGETLCGPYHPLGLVRLGPDAIPPHKTNGYQTALPLLGFSHTHVSGTGGQGRFGNVRLTPFLGRARLGSDPQKKRDETASIGRYGVVLEPSGIAVALTSSPRCGVSRFTFPTGQPGNVLIDAAAVHQHYSGSVARCLDSSIEWVSDHAFVGHGRFQGGWGHDFPYSVWFYGETSQVPDRVFCADEYGLAEKRAASSTRSATVAGWKEPGTVEVRIGISFVSIAKARASVARELGSQRFEAIEAANRDAWQHWFDRVQVEGGTPAQRTLFYTFLTRLLCMPSDLGVDDEFPAWESGVRHFSEIYCLWDSVRNANSLLMLIAPEFSRDLLNCLLDIADKTGWLPDAWVTGHSAQVQGGSSADILFNEAHLKGIAGIDFHRALAAMARNNAVESTDPRRFGRHLAHYRDLGFVSSATINCVSRHLEYAYQDWCTASLAERLGDQGLSDSATASSAKVWNLWHDELLHFAPRDPDGSWAEPFDVDTCLPDAWNDPWFYEGRSRAWSYNVQHDFAELVRRCGGDEAFVERLDAFFAAGNRATKETFMHIPLLYHYAGRPGRSSAVLREILDSTYQPVRNGLPDNEDMGCHSAMYMCGLLGLYPMMGQDWYFLTAPAFTRSVLALGDGGPHLEIRANAASPAHRYIRAAHLDGEPFDRSYIRHHEIASGAVLELDLATEETRWAVDSRPPSPLSD